MARIRYVRDQNTLMVDGTSIDTFSVPVLEIRGGADIVEGFHTSHDGVLEPGTVLVIDPDTPGALMESTDAYDFKVAGVVSGANGVAPGIQLGQDGVMDGDTKVAMTGRVYVKCSAENGPIHPGDRLTTAAHPGHAMKATDATRSDGAVIGKAMSSLEDGTGLVMIRGQVSPLPDLLWMEGRGGEAAAAGGKARTRREPGRPSAQASFNRELVLRMASWNDWGLTRMRSPAAADGSPRRSVRGAD